MLRSSLTHISPTQHDLSRIAPATSPSPPLKRSKFDRSARFASNIGGILGGLAGGAGGAFMGGILGGLANGAIDRGSSTGLGAMSGGDDKFDSSNNECDSNNDYGSSEDYDSSSGGSFGDDPDDPDDPDYDGQHTYTQSIKRQRQRQEQELEQIGQTNNDVPTASKEDIEDETYFNCSTKVKMAYSRKELVNLCNNYSVKKKSVNKFIDTIEEFGIFKESSRYRVGIQETNTTYKGSNKSITALVTYFLVDNEHDKTLVPFQSLQQLSQYLEHNDMRQFSRPNGEDQPSFKIHQSFTLRPRFNGEKQEQNLNQVEKYILEVLAKEIEFTLRKASERGGREKPGKEEVTKKAHEAYDRLCDNKTNFVGLDNINRKDKKFFIVPKGCLEKANNAEEAMKMARDPNSKNPGMYVNLDYLSSTEGKEAVLTIPPKSDEVDPLNIIMAKHAFSNLFGGKRAAYSFSYVHQLDEKDCLLPPNSIGLVKTDFFLPGAAFPVATTVVKLNNTTERIEVQHFKDRRGKINGLFERVKANYNDVTRGCVNGIQNSYHQAGSREGNYGCHGNNASGPWVPKKKANQEEVNSIQATFAKFLQTFLDDWIKSLGCKELLCLLNQERATDFENTPRFSDIATGVKRALEFYCGMISEEVSLGRGETLQDRESH